MGITLNDVRAYLDRIGASNYEPGEDSRRNPTLTVTLGKTWQFPADPEVDELEFTDSGNGSFVSVRLKKQRMNTNTENVFDITWLSSNIRRRASARPSVPLARANKIKPHEKFIYNLPSLPPDYSPDNHENRYNPYRAELSLHTRLLCVLERLCDMADF
jgi:hypothetical protein